MQAILSADKNWGIGNEGKLLVRISADMVRFRKLTTGHPIIMGRKTFESLPNGALPGRKNIVLSRGNFVAEGIAVARNAQELSRLLGGKAQEAFVIGGEEIYRLLLPETTRVYVTKIDAAFAADTHFPNLDDLDEWELLEEGEWQKERDVKYRFCTYGRIGFE